MKILVTGGAGYIGSVLVNKLIDSGHQVKVIDDLSNGFKQNIDENADFIEGSILDNDKLNQALDDVEVVFHLAAKIRVEEGEREPELYKKVNIEGTLNLINKCTEKNIKKLVFASTAAVYGDPEDYPVNEKSRVNPVNVYGATKLEIDQYLEKNAKSLGLSSICFRFFNIGGAGDDARHARRRSRPAGTGPEAARGMTRFRFGAGLLLLLAVAAACAPLASGWLGHDPFAPDLFKRHAPASTAHPLGTDELGRDLLLRLLHGARVSLAVGLATALAAALIGTAVGVLAAWRGGALDAALMRLADGMLALPALLFRNRRGMRA